MSRSWLDLNAAPKSEGRSCGTPPEDQDTSRDGRLSTRTCPPPMINLEFDRPPGGMIGFWVERGCMRRVAIDNRGEEPDGRRSILLIALPSWRPIQMAPYTACFMKSPYQRRTYEKSFPQDAVITLLWPRFRMGCWPRITGSSLAGRRGFTL